MEIEQKLSFGARLVLGLDFQHAVTVQVAGNDYVLPRRKTAWSTARRKSFSCDEDRVWYVISPGWKGVREVHDKALIGKYKDVVDALAPWKVFELADQGFEVLVSLRGKSVFVFPC